MGEGAGGCDLSVCEMSESLERWLSGLSTCLQAWGSEFNPKPCMKMWTWWHILAIPESGKLGQVSPWGWMPSQPSRINGP